MTAYKKSSSGFLPFIQKNKNSSPYTTIQNRAKIDDSLKVIFGNERIHVNSLNLLSKEFGPNGEPVYEPDNSDARIRFFGRVGTYFSSDGQHIRFEPGTDTKGVEVTFYGTGLNFLGWRNGGANRNLTLKVDNGSPSAFIYDQTGNSSVLQQRNYKMNAIIPIVTNLPLAWHTVLLTHAEATEIFIFGFEIINDATKLTVKSGKAHGNGYEYELVNDQLIDYNLGFDNVLDINISTKGGRSVVFLDPSNGIVKKRLTTIPDDSTVNLVTNGTFDTDVSGWIGFTGTPSFNAGKGRLTTAVSFGYMYQDLTSSLVVGKAYKIRAEYSGKTEDRPVFLRMYSSAGGSHQNIVNDNLGSPSSGVLEGDFLYTGGTAHLALVYDATSSQSVDWDNITFVETGRKFLEYTDHSNESPYRKINFREFGRERADDFSTLAGGVDNRAFTLDDGTTTLICGNSSADVFTTGLRINNTGGVGYFVTLTFIGTGLDIIAVPDALLTTPSNTELFVDGVSIGTTFPLLSSQKQKVKLCSGLPYGTHTVKIQLNASSVGHFAIDDFIVYQPKKPELPKSSIELADYNLMADFISNTKAGAETVSIGILRNVSCVREGLFTEGSGGTTNWAFTSGINADVGFFRVETDRTTNAIFKKTIFGTGFDFRFLSDAGSASVIEVKIDGVLATIANFPLVSFSTYGGPTFNSGTGILDQTGGLTQSAGFIINGLDLKSHTITFTRTSAGGTQFRVGALDVITPIHAPHTTFGSLSLRDVRNFDSAKDVNKPTKDFKSDAKFSLSLGNILKSKNISQLLKGGTGEVYVWFEEGYDTVASMYGLHDNDGGVDWPTGSAFNSQLIGRWFQKFNILTSAGGVIDALSIAVNWIEKLEKDELGE